MPVAEASRGESPLRERSNRAGRRLAVIASELGTGVFTGDALDVLPTLASGAVDAIVTSPPYADVRPDVARIPAADYADWLAPFLVELLRVVSPAGSMLLNIGRKFKDGREMPLAETVLARAETIGWSRIDTIVWAKTNAPPPANPLYLHNRHELVYWLAPVPLDAYRGYDEDTRRPYAEDSLLRYGRRYFSDRKGQDEYRASRNAHPLGARPSSVVSVTVGVDKGVAHPTPMPSELARHLVSLSTPVGGLVLDPFAGSGTTVVAAIQRRRRGVGIELRPEYADEARDRIRRAVPEQPQTASRSRRDPPIERSRPCPRTPL